MPSLPIPIFSAAVLTFLFLRLWMIRGRLSPLAILLALCALQTVIIALAQHYEIPGMRPVQPIAATLIPPMAWCAFQWTVARPKRALDLAHLLVPLAALIWLLAAPQYLDVYVPGVFVIYGLLILTQSSKGPDAQPNAFLTDGHIPARIWQVIGLALMTSALSDLFIVAAISTGFGALKPWIITLFSIGNLLLIGVVSLSHHLPVDMVQETEKIRPTSDAEQVIWQRVQTYMADQKPYLDPDLTLARLARKLHLPAKTLSSVINRETGANVSRFVNEARIVAAQNALRSGESVTNAMLSSGFNTKSNFNREFLRITGDTPSKWQSDHSA